MNNFLGLLGDFIMHLCNFNLHVHSFKFFVSTLKIINLIALLRTSNSLLNPSLLKHLGGALLHSFRF